jgi:hypothetical protein
MQGSIRFIRHARSWRLEVEWTGGSELPVQARPRRRPRHESSRPGHSARLAPTQPETQAAQRVAATREDGAMTAL